MFKKDYNLRYDVAVIGGGPAGLMAAIKSSQRGKKTVLCSNDQSERPAHNDICRPEDWGQTP